MSDNYSSCRALPAHTAQCYKQEPQSNATCAAPLILSATLLLQSQKSRATHRLTGLRGCGQRGAAELLPAPAPGFRMRLAGNLQHGSTGLGGSAPSRCRRPQCKGSEVEMGTGDALCLLGPSSSSPLSPSPTTARRFTGKSKIK